MTATARYNGGMHKAAQFALFVTSYTPLFLLIIGKQFTDNLDLLHFAGFSAQALWIWLTKFGLSCILTSVLIYGFFGYRITIRNLEASAKNGDPVRITRINNKSGESIGYIATYIVPFMFQGFDTLFEFIAVIVILALIFRIYVNSPLLLVNPILSITHGLYEVEYSSTTTPRDGSTTTARIRVGYAISKNKQLDEDDRILLYSIGHRLFYTVPMP